MIKKRSFRGLGLGPIGSILAITGLFLRLVVPTFVAPIASPLDALPGSPAVLDALAFEICRHSEPSSAEKPEQPTPQKKRAHDCMACCTPASLARIPPQAIDLPVCSDARVNQPVTPTPVVAALSVHVVRQRGPPPV